MNLHTTYGFVDSENAQQADRSLQEEHKTLKKEGTCLIFYIKILTYIYIWTDDQKVK